MAFPTTTHTSTTLASFIPSLWGEKINDFYKSKLVMADFFVDRSSELSDGGNVLYTPNMTEMSATAKSNATAVTLVAPTDTKITLTVDQWYEVSFAIEDSEAARMKHSYYTQEKYAQGAGFAVAKVLETAIANLFDEFAQVVGTSVAVLLDSDIRAAINYLEVANIDTQSDCAFFVAPAVNRIAALSRNAINKLCKFRENLFEIILSETQKWGRATTIITYLTPAMAR